VLTNLEVYSSLSTAPDLPLLAGVGEDQDPIHIRDITGLGPVKATINTSPYGSMDADFYTGGHVGQRNIVMRLGFNPDYVTETVATLRDKVYNYFMSKQPVTLRLFRDNGPAVEIDGITESCEPNIFAQDPEIAVSVICPDPDFVAVSPSIIDGIANENPDSSDFTLIGNIDTSGRVVISANAGDATYTGLVTLEHQTLAPGVNNFKVTGTIDPAETLVIDSARGAKVAQNIVGPETNNLLNTMTDDSVWLTLRPGTNKFRVLLEAGATDHPWELTYYERFGGL